MSYTCQNCGTAADDYTSLCNPTSEKIDNKFCGAPAVQVCKDKLKSMQYSCDACGSVSAEADNLCKPSRIS